MNAIANLDWISAFQQNNLIVISTPIINYLGVHTIVVVQNYTLFPNVMSFSSFSVNVTAPLVISGINYYPPYFSPPIPPKIVVEQCNNSLTSLWNYNFPTILDPNDSPVTSSAQYN